LFKNSRFNLNFISIVYSIKTKEEIKILKEGGIILSRILKRVALEAKVGVSAKYLDDFAYKLIKKNGGEPSFLNYKPDFALKPFPNSLCVSLNEVIVHGLPKEDLIFKDGDVVSLDLGLKYKNLFTDMALTIGVGKVKPLYQKMIRVCRGALNESIKTIKANKKIGDIGWTIENYVKKNGFVVVKELVGHGVGYEPHEDPLVYNFGEKNTGLALKEGMVIAIEPMITLKNGTIRENSDGSFSTLNNEVAVHFEKTVAVLKNRVLIITP